MGWLSVEGETWVAKEADSSGVIHFDNGTLNTDGLITSFENLRGTGTINTRGLVSDVNLIFDRPSSLSQSWRLDDPGQNISINLEMDGTRNIGAGYEGTALLQITDGVKVESLDGYLGYKAGSSGTALVVGAGSAWNNSGSLHVGGVGSGTLTIGDGGTVTALGDTTFGTNSTLGIELFDTSSGPFLFADSLELDGTLEISLAENFRPESGDSFDILDFNTVSGSFAEMNLPVLEDSLLWDSSQLLTDGRLCVGSCAVGFSGDYNDDGTVDAADYTLWQDNLGLDSSVLNGNGSGASTVVQADYLLWKTHFGESVASGSEADPVPEPTTLLLAGLLALAAVPLRMRCR